MKKVFTKLFLFLIIFSLCVSCISFAYASNCTSSTFINTIEIGDTLGYTQAEYLELIHANYDGSIAQIRSSTLEKDLIQNICSVFIAIGRASVRNTDYDCMVLVNQESQTDKTILYRVSEYEYLNAMNQALNYEILSDELVLSDFNVSIAEDSATVSVVESYTYDITDGFEGESFRRRQYYFTLALGESGWSVINITTNDPVELTDEFEYEPIDIESAINNLMIGCKQENADSCMLISDAQSTRESVVCQVENTASARTTLYRWTYDIDAAVEYAENYYSASSSSGYNTLFGYASENCQNFASQCVWAGFVGDWHSATSYKTIPAVSTDLVGSAAANVWCHNQYTNYYSTAAHNWAWDNVRGFAKLMSTSISTRQGPYGGVHFGTLAYVDRGDVIAWHTGGTPSVDALNHAMFVTEVSGTLGSRTKANVKISANNSSTNSAYQSLASYAPASYTDSYFADSIILSAYYSSPQS